MPDEWCDICGLPRPTGPPTPAPDRPLMPGEPTECLIDHAPPTLWARAFRATWRRPTMPSEPLSDEELGWLHDDEANGKCSTYESRLLATVAALRARAERAEAQLAAAREVIRLWNIDDGNILTYRKWTPVEVAEIHAATNQPGDEEEADVPPEVRDYQPGEQT